MISGHDSRKLGIHPGIWNRTVETSFLAMWRWSRVARQMCMRYQRRRRSPTAPPWVPSLLRLDLEAFDPHAKPATCCPVLAYSDVPKTAS